MKIETAIDAAKKQRERLEAFRSERENPTEQTDVKFFSRVSEVRVSKHILRVLADPILPSRK